MSTPQQSLTLRDIISQQEECLNTYRYNATTASSDLDVAAKKAVEPNPNAHSWFQFQLPKMFAALFHSSPVAETSDAQPAAASAGNMPITPSSSTKSGNSTAP